MGKVMGILYGIVLIYLAADALFLGFIPSDLFRAVVAIFIGVLIMLTHHSSVRGNIRDAQRTAVYGRKNVGFFQWIRRWIFGGAVILVGVISLVMDSGSLPRSMESLSVISLESWLGQLIIVAIGAIYLLSSFDKTRGIEMPSLGST